MPDQPDQRDMIGVEDGDCLLEEGAAEVPESKWAPTLVQMVQVVEARLRRQRVKDAEAHARGVVLELANYFGARQFYLPRGDRLRTALRDMEIYRRARRGNIEALAEEHGLSVIQVYRIVRQQKELHLRKVQGRLFDASEGKS